MTILTNHLPPAAMSNAAPASAAIPIIDDDVSDFTAKESSQREKSPESKLATLCSTAMIAVVTCAMASSFDYGSFTKPFERAAVGLTAAWIHVIVVILERQADSKYRVSTRVTGSKWPMLLSCAWLLGVAVTRNPMISAAIVGLLAVVPLAIDAAACFPAATSSATFFAYCVFVPFGTLETMSALHTPTSAPSIALLIVLAALVAIHEAVVALLSYAAVVSVEEDSVVVVSV